MAVVALVPALQARPALAYSGTEHIRHSDQAYQILNVMRRGAAYAVQAQRLDPVGALAGRYQPLTQCPESICPVRTCPDAACAEGRQWKRFVAEALAAPARLDLVKTDLADPDPFLLKNSCGNELPKVAPDALARCRIGELPFAARSGWGSSQNECYLRPGYIVGGADQNPASEEGHASGPVFPFFQDLQSNLSGAAIGMWSTGPDEAREDTRLWVRPSNLAFLGAVKQGAQAVADTALTAGLIISAPLVCIADFAWGRNCFSDARSAAHVIDGMGDQVVGVFEQSTVGQFTDVNVPLPLPGLWHFGTVGREGRFNKLAGIHLAQGGPNGEIGDLDLAIMVTTDLLGATVQSDESQGVRRYTPFADGAPRMVGDWLGTTVAHVEFEPAQNLAQWGWSEFRAGRLNAKGLGWVLHAIGDAGQPHHTIGALGWGHAEWERFANLSWEETFQEEDVVRHYPDLREMVTIAFRWWKFLDDGQVQQGGDLPVREMISALFTETARLPVSTIGRAYQRGLSQPTGRLDGAIRAVYRNESASMKDLMQRAIGASMGFLVKASAFVSAADSSPCDCGRGASRFAQDDAGQIVTGHDGLCHDCGLDVFARMPNWVDGVCVAACPPDKPTPQNGSCVAAGACPAAAPFVDGGACVARCSGAKVVVNHRSCEVSCPAPQRPDAAGFCVRLPAEPRRMCSGVTDDGANACCAPRGTAVETAAECCSRDRNPEGFCRGVTGDQCVTSDDCSSFSCLNHRCVLVAAGGRCSKDGDCASAVCGDSRSCLGAAGEGCSYGAQCVSGHCAIGPGSVQGVCGDLPE